ncbi:right-handed parallel beta-helix repeat-containing protein [Bosea sp. 685]|uniref:right-handed parallel beta-helix repeat-containing protein n=1 Tax=Bosea sp. 685 TaxID=3080057 RepID=UPI00289319FC|nr:right-handed parallel beta-helix repeat-containing protein [Bosea sp. 685]WNJ91778.1 hypothetical protein RMR04_05585 [Bosea sp. 685]
MSQVISPLIFNSFTPAAMSQNRTSLQTAIGAGGSYQIPSGVIAYNTQIGQYSSNLPLNLVGDGKQITRLYPTGFSGPAIEFGIPANGNTVLCLEKFDIVGDQSQVLLHVQNVSAPIFRDLTLDNGYYGMQMLNTWASILENCFFVNSKGIGLYIEGATTSNGYALKNCRFFNCGHPNTQAALVVSSGDGIYIGQIDLEGCYAGIQLDGCTGVHIDTPYIERNAHNPLAFISPCQGIAITGGWIAGESGQPPSEWYIGNVQHLKLNGTTLFNLTVKVESASTSDVDFSTCKLINTTIQYV